MNLTWAGIKHFIPAEFDSPDLIGSGERNMDLGFVKKIDEIRDLIARPLLITSGFRTPAHNTKIGGKPNSAHLRGLAVDLSVGTDSSLRFEIVRAAILTGFKRFEDAPAHIHLDMDASLPQKVFVFLPHY